MAIKTEYLIAECELQYILYFLVIAFIFTSSKCDVIIYFNYDHHLNFWSCVKILPNLNIRATADTESITAYQYINQPI